MGPWISDSNFYRKNLRFIYYIVRIFDQRCFGVYSLSNLLNRMLRLHSFQPCPQHDFANIQYSSQDRMLRILVLLVVIISDVLSQDLLTIHFWDSSL